MVKIPAHLKRYIVEQDYSRYTAIDQSVWRFILRQLKTYLKDNAHECYINGLDKTGIKVDSIPHIHQMSQCLQKYGWQAAPVSGFIPPAAFMELQSLKILPIACDMRTLKHLTYTPAPDIVHEAAGHAPILIDPEFSQYLQNYSEVASKAILNEKDLQLYEAIRLLSDLKERPDATEEQIKESYENLNAVVESMGEPSEGANLARMNWWTAEYGLIGSLDNPKIYGAGLMSSVGESKSGLLKAKHIPFTLDCLKYSYDITEPQPQLFVTPSFKELSAELLKYSKTMAYKLGGVIGLKKAQISNTVNTVELNSGLQISGILKDFNLDNDQPIYLQFSGPTQLCQNSNQIQGHGTEHHKEGFGCPIGHVSKSDICLSEMTTTQLEDIGLALNKTCHLEFKSGVVLNGLLTNIININSKNIIFTFSDCTVKLGDKILFDPAWGTFDMGVGHNVVSVFGGAADRKNYGEIDDFVVKHVPKVKVSETMQKLIDLYSRVRVIRENLKDIPKVSEKLDEILIELNDVAPNDWLLRLEMLEIAKYYKQMPAWAEEAQNTLKKMSLTDVEPGPSIERGLEISDQLFI